MNRKKTFFNWSTGKDAALALYRLRKDPNYSVELLLTSINTHFDRVSMHGLRRSLMRKQMNALALPFDTIELPEMPTMSQYEEIMHEKIMALKKDGYTHAAFGDIFLEDLKAYREKALSEMGISAVFPLWKEDTTALMEEFLQSGFRAIIVTTKADLLDESFVGKELTKELIDQFPDEVDPCGENGEFHTFCFDGPIFRHPVEFALGEKVYRVYDAPITDEDNCYTEESPKKMGFWYIDLQ